MKQLRILTLAVAVLAALTLGACAERGGGPQSATDAGGGTAAAPGSATATQPPEGAAENPPPPSEPPPAASAQVAAGPVLTDCSTVRCAPCPEGKRPALTPPNCCRCIPE